MGRARSHRGKRTRRSGPGAVQLTCAACDRVIRVVDDRTNIFVPEEIRHTATVAVVPSPVPPVEEPVTTPLAERFGQAVGRAFARGTALAAAPALHACACGETSVSLTPDEVVDLVIDAQDRGVRRVPLVARTVAQDR